MSRGKLRDIDIRSSLKKTVLLEYYKDRNSLVIEELGIEYGNNRVDIAVINGKFHGYEIKSQTDDLTRLPSQATAYNRVFDCLTLIVHDSHLPRLDRIKEIANWTILAVSKQSGRENITYQTIQEGTVNLNVDKISIAMLLWKEEILNLLSAKKADRGYKSKKRDILVQRLVDVYSEDDELSQAVRQTIKSRKSWRVDLQPV